MNDLERQKNGHKKSKQMLTLKANDKDDDGDDDGGGGDERERNTNPRMLKALSMCLPKIPSFLSRQFSEDARKTNDEFIPNILVNYI